MTVAGGGRPKVWPIASCGRGLLQDHLQHGTLKRPFGVKLWEPLDSREELPIGGERGAQKIPLTLEMGLFSLEGPSTDSAFPSLGGTSCRHISVMMTKSLGEAGVRH